MELLLEGVGVSSVDRMIIRLEEQNERVIDMCFHYFIIYVIMHDSVCFTLCSSVVGLTPY